MIQLHSSCTKSYPDDPNLVLKSSSERSFVIACANSKEFSFSTPNRLLLFFDGLQSEIHQSEEEIRGPKVDAPEKAIIGFLRSNNLKIRDLFKKETDKENLSNILEKYSQEKKELLFLQKNIVHYARVQN